jgi:chaperone modulatory protein CbpM
MTQHESTYVEVLDGSLTLIEFCSYAQLPRQHVIDMIEAGVLEPLGDMTDELLEDWCRFAAHDLRRARIARRLMNDLGVNLDGAAMILDLIEERDALHSQIGMLEKMLER